MGGGGTDGGVGGRPAAPGTTQALPPGGDDHGGANFPGVEKLPLYLPRKRCEICVTVLMRKIAQVPFLCHGFEYYFETCNDVVASILHWYPNVVYWSYTGGCTKKGAVGETFVRPCPPHAICSWLASPNYNQPFCPWDGQYAAPGLEDQPAGRQRDGHAVRRAAAGRRQHGCACGPRLRAGGRADEPVVASILEDF